MENKQNVKQNVKQNNKSNTNTVINNPKNTKTNKTENTKTNTTSKFTPISDLKQNLFLFINNTFFSSDLGLLLTIIIIFVGISFGGVIAFENLSLIRYSFINNTIGIIGSLVFIYFIYTFSSTNAEIIGVKLNLGYIFYVITIITLFILFSG